MDDFRCKPRLLAGGNMNETPANIMYAKVVSRDTVRITAMIATLNDLVLTSGDILNAYIQAPVIEYCGLLWRLSLGKTTDRLQ